MQTTFIRRLYLLVPLGLLLYAGIYGACTPGSEITAAESDVVVTLFDTDFKFSSVKRYAMPDSIFHLTGDSTNADSPLLSRDSDDEIIALVQSNFADRGYVKVDTNAVPPPEFTVLLTAQAVQNWNLYSYYPWNPWYGWWGYYWWYYPPSVGVSYAFTLGTMYIHMGEFEEHKPDEEDTKTAYWLAAMNGILDDSSSNKQQRLNRSINQAFEQSPYLKTN